MNRITAAAVTVLIGLLAFSPPALAQYVFTSFDNPSAVNGTYGFGINNSGQVGGGYYDADNNSHAFLYEIGVFIDIDYPKSTWSRAEGINNSGETVGPWRTGNTGYHGFLYDSGAFTTFDDPSGIDNTCPYGINDGGQITGVYWDKKGSAHGFLKTGSTFATFEYPSSSYTAATGINNSGQVTGYYYPSASDGTYFLGFVKTGNTFAPIVYPSSWETCANGINNSGLVTGYYTDSAGGDSHGFLYDGINYTTVDYPGSISTVAASINDSGQITGWYKDSVGIHGFIASPVPDGTFYGPNNPAITAGTPACGEFDGDPVDCDSGNLTETVTDLSIPGRGRALNLTRTYNSQDAASGGYGTFGAGWSSSYGESLNIATDGSVTVHQAGGATVKFTPLKTGYTAPSYVTAKLVKNKNGTYTFTLKNQQSDTFDKNGRLISQTDRNGLVTALAYDSNGLATVTDPAGRQLVFTTASNGLVSKVTDPAGRTVSYAHDSSENLVSVTDVGGGTTSYSYTSNHLLATTTDPLGGQISNLYDSSNRVVSQTDQLQNTTSFLYAPSVTTNITTVTDPNGNVSVHTFSSGLLISLTEGFGTGQAATWTYGYDSHLNRISITDANGKVWNAAYDSRGNQIAKMDPMGYIVITTYTSLNDPAKITDQLGVTTTLTYSSYGDLASSSRPLTGTSLVATTTFVHGDPKHPGDLTSVTDPTGAKTTFTYDTYGNKVSITDPDGGKTTRSFDIIGRMLTSISPLGNTTSYTYDAFGKVLTVTDPLGHTATNTYDAKEELISFTDRDGNQTIYAYSSTGKLLKTVRPDGSVLLNSYDANGNLTARTDGNGNTTVFAYDPLDRLSSMTDALGRASAYVYDGNGDRIKDTAPDGETVSRTYDAAGRLTAVTYSDGQTHGVTYQYDKTGRRIEMTDGSGTSSLSSLTWQYDSLGRLTQAKNGAGETVSYAYDLRGLPTGITYPNNESVTRVYDKAGRLSSVKDWLKNTTKFQYDADGNLLGTTYPNGWTGQYQYDKNDRVTGIDYKKGSSGLLSFGYTRTNAGLLSSEALNSGTPIAYSYDGVLRLVDVSNQVAYTYDDADRVTAMPAAVTLAYDDGDQLTTGQGGPFSYDQRANRTSYHNSGQTLDYTYDGANRLTGYEGTATYTYAYDGDGLRVSKTTGSTTEAYVWDRQAKLPAILVDGSSYYVYGPWGTPLEQVSASGTVLFYHADQLGSIRMLTDSKGDQAATYTYNVYGNLVSSTGQVSNPFGFAGAYTDAESGLLYMRTRYYDPLTAQFISRDPLFAATGQAYAYAGDSPTNLVDPTGLQGCGTPWFPNPFSQEASQSAPQNSSDAWQQMQQNQTNSFQLVQDVTANKAQTQDKAFKVWDEMIGSRQDLTAEDQAYLNMLKDWI